MIKKLKAFGNSFFSEYWKETTIRISENQVIELGGFIATLIFFLCGLFLLNYLNVIHLF